MELEENFEKLENFEIGLQKTKDLCLKIIQASNIPLFVIDKDHFIIHCNKAFENLTGLYATDLVGTKKQWLAFYPEERPVLADFIVDNAPQDTFSRYYGDRLSKSKVLDGAYESQAWFRFGEDKKGKWLFFSAAPLKDDEGNIIGAVETLQDISPQKDAEELLFKSWKRLRGLLDFVPYPILGATFEGNVYYLNPAFTRTFGWTLDELEGKTVPYLLSGMEEKDNSEIIKRILDGEGPLRCETKRRTKDGKIIDVVMRMTAYLDDHNKTIGTVTILRDITKEKRAARNNEAMLRISMALPEYPDLESLLDFVSSEVKRLIDTEGSTVMLLSENKEEFSFLGASYDDSATNKRMKEIRVSVEKLSSGKVFNTGNPMVINDVSDDPEAARYRDEILGFHARNLVIVPLRSRERFIGVLCAINKKEGDFDEADIEILEMIAGTVDLSIENARYSNELKKAYQQVSNMNEIKGKVLNHLSHELKTPLAILSWALKSLEKRLVTSPEDSLTRVMERAGRSINRILGIQDEVDDIVWEKRFKTAPLLSSVLDQCADHLKLLFEEQLGETGVIEDVRLCIDDLFESSEIPSEKIFLNEYISAMIEELSLQFQHRKVDIISDIIPVLPYIYIPLPSLKKIVTGLIKNAVENTPDKGKIEIFVRKNGDECEFEVHDYGVGITPENKHLIFTGFFPTQETLAYSTKRPFDFNAGGKGADLLRMRIFSERYNFKIEMKSVRCRFIPASTDICPGDISKCGFCRDKNDCYESGGTSFIVRFQIQSA